MCFSSGASFGAGAMLAVAGITSITQARKPSQLPFAAIPLLFAAQQIAEGFVWLDQKETPHTQWGAAAMYVFLFFAQVVWPFWVPLSIWLLEKNTARKKILLAVLCLGIFTALNLAYLLFTLTVKAAVHQHHIFYELDFRGVSTQANILYFISTAIPCLLSSIRSVRWLGISLMISLLLTYLFSTEEFISVWCFFAALLSIMIFFILKHLRISSAPMAE